MEIRIGSRITPVVLFAPLREDVCNFETRGGNSAHRIPCRRFLLAALEMLVDQAYGKVQRVVCKAQCARKLDHEICRGRSVFGMISRREVFSAAFDRAPFTVLSSTCYVPGLRANIFIDLLSNRNKFTARQMKISARVYIYLYIYIHRCCGTHN